MACSLGIELLEHSRTLATSPIRLPHRAGVRNSARSAMTAVSSRKVSPDIVRQVLTASMSTHCSSAVQYASCCSRARAKSGTPNRTLVSPSQRLARRTDDCSGKHLPIRSATSCERRAGCCSETDPTQRFTIYRCRPERPRFFINASTARRGRGRRGTLRRIDRVADRK